MASVLDQKLTSAVCKNKMQFSGRDFQTLGKENYYPFNTACILIVTIVQSTQI